MTKKMRIGGYVLCALLGVMHVLAVQAAILPQRKPVRATDGNTIVWDAPGHVNHSSDLSPASARPQRKPSMSAKSALANIAPAAGRTSISYNTTAARVKPTASTSAKSDRHGSKTARLSTDDAARYAHIFAFQATEDFDKADAEIAKLNDQRLMGHVLSQRYLSRTYRSQYAELTNWMRRYRDHPQAERIYNACATQKTCIRRDSLTQTKEKSRYPRLPQP